MIVDVAEPGRSLKGYDQMRRLLIGTDDVLQSALLNPPLTIFTIPKFELGRTGAAGRVDCWAARSCNLEVEIC